MVTHITMVATLPPIKGVSDYTLNHVPELAKFVKVDFYNFSDIYPEFWYPGGTKENDPIFKMKPAPNATIHHTLTWYNPLTWISAGLHAKGEILHFHWWTFYLSYVFWTIVAFAKLRGKKIVCTAHNILGHESGALDKFFTRSVFWLVDEFIVHSEQNRKQLNSFFGVPLERIHVNPHGNYDFYNDTPVTQEAARKKLGIPKDAKVIMSFGNLRKYKGFDDLITAFKTAKKKVPELYLMIAGKPWNKEMADDIRNQLKDIADVKLAFDYIASSDIKYYFNSADIVVLPYHEFSGQSGPGNIALAFGKPLIVSRVGGLPELVMDENTIFEPHDVKGLTVRIENAFTKKGMLAKLSKEALIMKKKYSWDTITQQTLLVYKSVLRE
jgi:glycosyltransferase involved in cell wall biosynthesis